MSGQTKSPLPGGKKTMSDGNKWRTVTQSVLADGAADTEGDSSTDQPDGVVTNIHIT